MIRAITTIFCINFIAIAGSALSCGRPQVPKYMRIQPDRDSYTNGSSVAYYCSPDKVLVGGSRISTCDNGKWFERIPVCASYNRNITLISVMKKSNSSDYYDTEIPEQHYSSSCYNESHPIFSWQMNGTEMFAFNLSEQQTLYKFIRLKLVVISLDGVSVNENLLKSVINPKVNIDKECEIYAEGDNEYYVVCVFATYTKSVPILSIEPSMPPISVTLLKFEVGFVEQECGDMETPIGARVFINGNTAVIECNNNRIEFTCDNGVWSSDYGSPRCESQPKPLIDPQNNEDNMVHDKSAKGRVKPKWTIPAINPNHDVLQNR